MNPVVKQIMWTVFWVTPYEPFMAIHERAPPFAGNEKQHSVHIRRGTSLDRVCWLTLCESNDHLMHTLCDPNWFPMEPEYFFNLFTHVSVCCIIFVGHR